DYSKVNNAISYEASKESMEQVNKSITPEANTQPEFSNSKTTNEIITPQPKAKTVVIPTESVTDLEAGSVRENNQSETVVPKVIPTPVAKSKAATSANSDIKKVVKPVQKPVQAPPTSSSKPKPESPTDPLAPEPKTGQLPTNGANMPKDKSANIVEPALQTTPRPMPIRTPQAKAEEVFPVTDSEIEPNGQPTPEPATTPAM
ncbi:MAG: hypothetical protein ACRCXZ_06995, partial [Patescibacteria group bacterium]